MGISCSGYKLFFSLIIFTQFVNCGPQGWRAENSPYNYPDDPSLSDGSGPMAESQPSDYSNNPSLSSDPSLSNESGSMTGYQLQDSPRDSSQTDSLPPYSVFAGNQSLQPSPTDPSNCQICTISVSSVSLYYWPQTSTDTACLATISPPPSPTMPSGLTPISPSAYALFFAVTVSNDCNLTTSYATSTASFDQNSLSTLDGNGNPQSFNLADLPCPPSSITLTAGQRYQPVFAWNRELFFGHNYEPSECKTMTGLAAWPDPPTAFPTATGGVPGPTAGDAPPRARLRREAANAHVTSWVPAITTAAT